MRGKSNPESQKQQEPKRPLRPEQKRTLPHETRSEQFQERRPSRARSEKDSVLPDPSGQRTGGRLARASPGNLPSSSSAPSASALSSKLLSPGIGSAASSFISAAEPAASGKPSHKRKRDPVDDGLKGKVGTGAGPSKVLITQEGIGSSAGRSVRKVGGSEIPSSARRATRFRMDNASEKNQGRASISENGAAANASSPPVPNTSEGGGASFGIQSLLRRIAGGVEELFPGAGSTQSRLKAEIQHLRTAQQGFEKMAVLSEICEIISVSTEEALATFPINSLVTAVVECLMPPNDAETLLVAARILNELLEVVPASDAFIVKSGALEPLCNSLLSIEYIDLAEQSLSVLNRLSADFPGPIIEHSGFAAALLFIDFFSIPVQRTAASLACNLCRNCPADAFESVSGIVPNLLGLLNSDDQRIQGSAISAFYRLGESFRADTEKLEVIGGCSSSNGNEQVLLDTLCALLLAPQSTGALGPAFRMALSTLAVFGRGSSTMCIHLLKHRSFLNLLARLMRDSSVSNASSALSVLNSLLPDVNTLEAEHVSSRTRRRRSIASSASSQIIVDKVRREWLVENSDALDALGPSVLASLLDFYQGADNANTRRMILAVIIKYVAYAAPRVLLPRPAVALVCASVCREDGSEKRTTATESGGVDEFLSFVWSLLKDNESLEANHAALQMVELIMSKVGEQAVPFMQREGIVCEVQRISEGAQPGAREKHKANAELSADILSRAISVFETYFSGASATETDNQSVSALRQISGLLESGELEKATVAVSRLVSRLEISDKVTNYEFVSSGLVDALFDFFCEPCEASVRTERILLFHKAFAEHPTAYACLVRRIICIFESQEDSSIVSTGFSGHEVALESSLRKLAQPLKLRVRIEIDGGQKEHHAAAAREFMQNVFMVDAFTNMTKTRFQREPPTRAGGSRFWSSWQRLGQLGHLLVPLLSVRQKLTPSLALLQAPPKSDCKEKDAPRTDHAEKSRGMDRAQSAKRLERAEDLMFEFDGEDHAFIKKVADDGNPVEDPNASRSTKEGNDALHTPHLSNSIDKDMSGLIHALGRSRREDVGTSSSIAAPNLSASEIEEEMELVKVVGAEALANSAENDDDSEGGDDDSEDSETLDMDVEDVVEDMEDMDIELGSVSSSLPPTELDLDQLVSPTPSPPASLDISRGQGLGFFRARSYSSGSGGGASQRQSYATATRGGPAQDARGVSRRSSGKADKAMSDTDGLASDHLEFFFHESPISLNASILEAVVQNIRPQNVPSLGTSASPSSSPRSSAAPLVQISRVWEEIHTIGCRLVSDDGRDAGKASSSGTKKAGATHRPERGSDGQTLEKQVAYDLGNFSHVTLPSLEMSSGVLSDTASRTLAVLRSVSWISRHHALLSTKGGESSNPDCSRNLHFLGPSSGDGFLVDSELFVCRKLQAKVLRQLSDPLALSARLIAPWCFEIARKYPFILDMRTRMTLFSSCELGLAQGLLRLQSRFLAGENLSSDATERRHASASANRGRPEFRIGRIHREKVRIDRRRVLDSAIKIMDKYGSHRTVLEIEYTGEAGTGLGPTLEFYTLVCTELQREDLMLWRNQNVNAETLKMRKDDLQEPVRYVTPTGTGLFPRCLPVERGGSGKDCAEAKRILAYFRLLGQVAAKALMDGRLLDIHISSAMYGLILAVAEQLPASETISHRSPQLSRLSSIRRSKSELSFLQVGGSSMHHLQEVDPALARSLGTMLELNASSTHRSGATDVIEDMCLSFVVPGDDTLELIPGGRGKAVTGKNLDEYVRAVLKYVLHTGVVKQIHAFVCGFDSILNVKALLYFAPEELDVMLCGPSREAWDTEYLLHATQCDHGYSHDSDVVRYLFEYMIGLDEDGQRRFLKFLTGSPRLPVGGLLALRPKITIVRRNPDAGSTPDQSLPTVMTCTNYLKVPEYSSLETLRARFEFAIREGQGAFHLS
ncbi:E3 ubiquitin-protein ligase UPL3 [Porphyridium purpureum]|uniref:HECT-type E3 ubiquitin transferase n=1 Tax=Porphyridium purpureum TaxID=35688 RepID=A0A5J4Z0L3_PORPP|nr:E3 ubiquitin-protein ligase UPL3 [Porphyridium purpureum]|eukprot:POR4970..scf208_2